MSPMSPLCRLVAVHPHDSVVRAVAGAVDKMGVEDGVIERAGTLADAPGDRQRRIAPGVRFGIINEHTTFLAGAVRPNVVVVEKDHHVIRGIVIHHRPTGAVGSVSVTVVGLHRGSAEP